MEHALSLYLFIATSPTLTQGLEARMGRQSRGFESRGLSTFSPSQPPFGVD